MRTEHRKEIFKSPCLPSAYLMSPLKIISQNNGGNQTVSIVFPSWLLSPRGRAGKSNSDFTNETLDNPDHIN